MNYSSESIKKAWGILSIILSIFAIFGANYSKTFEDIVNVIKPTNLDVTYLSYFNLSVKIGLIMIGIILYLGQYLLFLLFYDLKSISLKKHNIQSITKRILNDSKIKDITIFGYSLSFAESLRENLNKGAIQKIKIKLIVPDDNMVGQMLKDGHTKESRVSEINSRLFQWNTLKTNDRIERVEIIRTKSIPVENGFLINNNYLYLDYYKWKPVGESFILDKKPFEDRCFIYINNKHGHLFEYILYQLGVKK